MFYSDLHTHTHFSFDSEENIDASCEKAISLGLSAIAITNHCDYDSIEAGIYPDYDFAADREEILAAKERFAPKLRVFYGIELGQPWIYPESWKKIRETYKPEFVLASIHNLKDVPDFCLLRYESMSDVHCLNLLGRYFDEMEKMLDIDGLTSLSHMTYPIRYMKQAGKDISLASLMPKIERILHKVIAKGMYFEVNTSGLRQGVGSTLPDDSIIELYRSFGGEKITVGSDAHYAKDVGSSVIEITDKLAKMGFTQIGMR